MYVCQACGINLPDGASFCPNCGVKLDPSNMGEAPKPLPPSDTPVVAPDPVEPEPAAPRKRPRFRLCAAHFLFMIPVLILVGFVGLIIVALTTEPVTEINPPVELFHEGLVPVQTGDGNAEPLWGYIDRNGQQVIDAKFDAVSNFGSNGLAAVCYLGKWGYIDKSGEFVVPAIYEEARNFGKNNYAPVKANGSWGYIDKSGALVINPQFDSAETFAENGLALVGIGDKYGYINRKGVYVIPPQYDDAESFGLNGHAAINAFGKWGLIDKNGEYVVNPQFDAIHPFASNGLSLVEKDGMFGYINRMGIYVMQPVFEEASSFGENGLALVKINGKYGYINEKCEFVIEAKYDKALPFSPDNGLAAVCPDQTVGTWGYINYNGAYVIRPAYTVAGSFNSGMAAVEDEKGVLYINEKGEEVFRPDENCLFITHFSKDGYAILAYLSENGENVFTIINKKGEPITKNRFPMVSYEVLASLLFGEES